jgi:hypothetical protein
MVHRLELAEELVLVVRVLNDDLYKINMPLNDTNEEIVTLLEATPDILLLEIHRTNPGLKHGSENAEIVTSITNLLHVTTQNDPWTHPHVLCEFTELLIIDHTGEDAGQKTLALSWIALADIGGDDETKDTIAKILQFFVVAVPQRETVVRSGRNDHLFSIFGLFLPQFRAIHVGLMTAGLREEMKILDATLPAVALH